MSDNDLADLYQVETKILNRAVLLRETSIVFQMILCFN